MKPMNMAHRTAAAAPTLRRTSRLAAPLSLSRPPSPGSLICVTTSLIALMTRDFTSSSFPAIKVSVPSKAVPMVDALSLTSVSPRSRRLLPFSFALSAISAMEERKLSRSRSKRTLGGAVSLGLVESRVRGGLSNDPWLLLRLIRTCQSGYERQTLTSDEGPRRPWQCSSKQVRAFLGSAYW
ncbi:hypothetical protein FOWG_18042 [Fusarium oxysporum f. sp. lycopersici MN25]|nr:hypothetical protein FOWG_18042 [Fusarium oxysporum f. sp. lycopersici MN25]